MKIILILYLSFLVLCFQTKSCSHKGSDDIERWKGLDEKNDIVSLYKNDVTYDERKKFEDSVLFEPYVKGYGHAHQEGIADLLLGRIVGDYDGGIVDFSANSTSTQREKLIKAIKASPLVFRVYENVVPNEIDDLPGSKNAEPSRSPDARPTKVPLDTDRN